jgi:hypothetical protein
MDRSPDTEGGFRSRFALASTSRLTNAVVASLALASLSLCLIVVLTVAATQHSMAMPLPL